MLRDAGKNYTLMSFEEVLLNCGVGAGPSDALAHGRVQGLPVVGRSREDAGGVTQLAHGGDLAGCR
jgi:hypothetical protein